MNNLGEIDSIDNKLIYIGKTTRIDKSIPLSKEERKQFNFHLKKISESIKKKNKATSNLIQHVNELLDKQLWRESYNSPDEFIQDVLRINESYYYRYAKANRTYLYLYKQTTDDNEKATLNLMTESVYRELRLIATDRHSNMNVRGENAIQYKERMKQVEQEQLILIKSLWDKLYPFLRQKKESQNKILSDGGFMINTTDIIKASSMLSENLSNYLNSESNLNKDEIAKIKKQKNRIDIRLSNGHVWDKYEGVLKIIDGRLFIENRLNKYDLSYELADLIKHKTPTVISVRRSNRWR